MKITKLFARQVLDSRGNPTVEVEAYFNNYLGRAIVPSGASTGKYEALELRDGKRDYLGKSVLKAVDNVNNVIAKKLVGMEFLDQRAVDGFLIKLDGTPNKSKLGANAILGVSMAVCRLAAVVKQKYLYEYIGELSGTDKKNFRIPIPFSNIINGGKHAGSSLKMQEFMITAFNVNSFKDAVRLTSETYHTLKKLIEEKYGKSAVNVGDEGGFAPQLSRPEEALDLITEAIKKAGYKNKIKIAMDCAASEFYDPATGNYVMDKPYSKDEMIEYYLRLIKSYDIISIEDPFDQDDFESFKKLTERTKIRIIGDDLLVTNPSRIQTAINAKLCNGLLLKLNQIGTVTEAIDAAKLALNAKWRVMVSHRSGETEDTFIADLAVGLGCGLIKLGAPCRSDRTAKYNQLLRIEENKIKYGI
ncbi:phosphopyruvate hydratase [Candidatus Woesearchaeota archaeon]|nr:phosphopyruvate hydratase [Candidatus Woesearchaeota archaeon]HIJ02568.1 phosphopyruvate hydratase [Candidatus Woesearchaeota archaeon]